jgi:hypothetical protein
MWHHRPPVSDPAGDRKVSSKKASDHSPLCDESGLIKMRKWKSQEGDFALGSGFWKERVSVYYYIRNNERFP